ncbi:MAG: glycine/betaine transporter [Actinomycetia bacterium]|nr:glycine/betaine transporter [Actinomycetes bacterium]
MPPSRCCSIASEVDVEPRFEFESVRVDGRNAGSPRLDDLSLRVPKHGITVVVGPSGAGKSTLLRVCNRLDVPDSGVVRLDGQDTATLDVLALRRRVGMVFQQPTPFPGTVRENLAVAQPGLSDDEAAEILARCLLDRAFLDRPATELSGGEQQRVCLARTLATRPEVLLMDEPTSALDQPSTFGLERLARRLSGEGIPILWVSHDLAQMARIADLVVVLMHGRVAQVAEPALLVGTAPPDVRAFLASDAESDGSGEHEQ